MRFVQIKSAEQQGQLMQHRTRDLLIRATIAVAPKTPMPGMVSTRWLTSLSDVAS
jgi:hypothetical protein